MTSGPSLCSAHAFRAQSSVWPDKLVTPLRRVESGLVYPEGFRNPDAYLVTGVVPEA